MRKYLLLTKWKDGRLETVVCDTANEMKDYLTVFEPYIEQIIVKMAFNADKTNSIIELLE